MYIFVLRFYLLSCPIRIILGFKNNLLLDSKSPMLHLLATVSQQ